jgi:hypothetical protein
MTIPALEIRSSVPYCELETHFEWFNKNHANDDGTFGRWEGRRTTENSGRLVVDIDSGSDKTVDVTIDQRYYMDEMKHMFGNAQFDGVLDEIKVLVRFITKDPASQSTVPEIIDVVEVKFVSSGETKIDYCQDEYDTLSIKAGTEMADINYTVVGDSDIATR